jgi:hypothetical protein
MGTGDGAAKRVSRSKFVKLGAAGLAGVAADAALGEGEASASTTDTTFVAENPGFTDLGAGFWTLLGNNDGRYQYGVTAEGTKYGVEGWARSSGAIGVHGLTYGTGAPAILGEVGDSSDAIQGTSSGIGVHGISSGSTGIGVYGENSSNGGVGVQAQDNATASGGYGVYSASTHGVAVQAITGDGTAVAAVAGGAGTALRVTGTAEFSRSGIAAVNGTTATPKSSVKVNLLTLTSTALQSTSIVLATIQGAAPAGTYVQNVVLNVATNTFTINLNQAVTQKVKIGWFVAN